MLHFQRITGLIVLLIICIKTTYASAFLIFGPEPEEYKKIDVTLYSSSWKTKASNVLLLPSAQINYGFKPDFDINLLVGYAFYSPYSKGIRDANGIADTIITATYRFLHESTYVPQMGFVPSILIPTGNYDAGLGNGKAEFFFPLSAQKSWGSWTVMMNFAYTYNLAPDTLNYFNGGVRLGYSLNSALNLGVELYTQGATSENTTGVVETSNSDGYDYIFAGGKYILLNMGGDYKITKNLYLQAGIGKSIHGTKVLLTYLGIDYQL